jgi:hypothetical protein
MCCEVTVFVFYLPSSLQNPMCGAFPFTLYGLRPHRLEYNPDESGFPNSKDLHFKLYELALVHTFRTPFPSASLELPRTHFTTPIKREFLLTEALA